MCQLYQKIKAVLKKCYFGSVNSSLMFMAEHYFCLNDETTFKPKSRSVFQQVVLACYCPGRKALCIVSFKMPFITAGAMNKEASIANFIFLQVLGSPDCAASSRAQVMQILPILCHLSNLK